MLKLGLHPYLSSREMQRLSMGLNPNHYKRHPVNKRKAASAEPTSAERIIRTRVRTTDARKNYMYDFV
jgi:hypothetical protein